MIYHIVTGDVAATPLREAIQVEAQLAGEVVVMKDVLSVGPLQKEEGQKFSELRSTFWQGVVNNDKNPVVVDDTERLSQVSIELSKNEEAKVWVWIAPWPADICTYYWTLKYLGAYTGRFFVLNIAGLPFLDENGKIFYPRSIGDLQPKEIIKARKLARPVTAAELEVDGEEWNKLVKENAGIRTHEGGKRIISKPETHYDNQLLSFCSQQYQKASKIVGQALSKFNIPTGDLYLGWRLRKLAAEDKLSLQGDVTKMLKDFDVKLPSGLLEFGDEVVAEKGLLERS
jgi:uncharacterized protein DUF3658/uncharacterized protein DUF1835